MTSFDSKTASELILAAQIHFCAMYAVCVWDWAVSLKTEYDFVWNHRWTPVKALYIFTRYWVLVTTPYILWVYGVKHQQGTCDKIYRSPIAIAIWNQVGAEALLLVRTYTLLQRSKVVLAALSSMLSATIAYQLYVALRKMLLLPFLDGISGPCLPMALPGEAHLLGFFFAPLLFDTVLTVMTLVQAIILHRKNDPSSRLVEVFLKEGFLYFVLISCANLLNGLFYLQHHQEMSAIAIPLSIMLSPLLACRMIIDVRVRARNGSIDVPGYRP